MLTDMLTRLQVMEPWSDELYRSARHAGLEGRESRCRAKWACFHETAERRQPIAC